MDAGSLKLAFGQTPDSYMAPVDAGTSKYRDLYWRFYVRNASNWKSGAGEGGDKLTRAMVFAKPDWSQAMIAHLWSGGTGSNYLMLDPASGTDTQGNLQTVGYNDFSNLRWLGAGYGQTPLFNSSHVGKWYCVEAHVRLNDTGLSNGVYEFWIDGNLEAREAGLNWLGSYSQYGINAIFLENYWNSGAPQSQARDLDNFVVSTQPIGCGGTTAPAPSTVQSVRVSPTSATLIAPDGTQQLSATAYDSNGNVVSGVGFEWTSSDSGVAEVSSSGMVYARAAGTVLITATAVCCGVQGTTTVSVQEPSSTNDSPDLLNVNFEKYNSTSDLLKDCTTWDCVEQVGDSDIALDNTVAPPGLTRSMRYHYRHSGNGCNSITIERSLQFPKRQQEVWAEFYIRWSSNFTTDNSACYPNDHKLIFGDTEADQSGRWAFYVGSDGKPHTVMVERPLGPNGFLGAYYLNKNSSGNQLWASDLWDGQWHVVRLHYRNSTTTSSNDGAMQVWVDGTLWHDERGFNTMKPASDGGGPEFLRGFSFCHNEDDGPPGVDMYLWWGSVKVWAANPGW